MSIIDNGMLWRQFGSAIDTLGGALRNCLTACGRRAVGTISEQWVMPGFAAFWYLGYHTLFWLDLYLTGAEEGFAPPAPFDLVEMEAGEVLPRVYTRDELLGYLAECRRRCEVATIAALTPDAAQRLCRFPWGELPFAELQLYSLRHVQEHAAQLNLFLGQQAGASVGWRSQA